MKLHTISLFLAAITAGIVSAEHKNDPVLYPERYARVQKRLARQQERETRHQERREETRDERAANRDSRITESGQKKEQNKQDRKNEIIGKKKVKACAKSSQYTMYFARYCNAYAVTSSDVIGLYEAGTLHPYTNDNSVLKNQQLYDNGFVSNTGQTLKLAPVDFPIDSKETLSFDYCVTTSNPYLKWNQPNNNWFNWFGFDTSDFNGSLKEKEITVSFNFKWSADYGTPSTTNKDGDAVGLKIAGKTFNDWFGENDKCVGQWCRFEKTVVLSAENGLDGDDQKILFFWNQMDANRIPGCFLRFNDFKVINHSKKDRVKPYANKFLN